jgi:hypothetical protein
MPREPSVIEAGDLMSDDDVDVAGDNGLVIATGSDASSVFSFGRISGGGGGGSLSLAAGGVPALYFRLLVVTWLAVVVAAARLLPRVPPRLSRWLMRMPAHRSH